MTVGVGLLIEAADYNAIRAKVSAIMGIGSGSTGYGQALYADADVSNGQLITATQLNNLQKDIIRARLHQVGTGLTGLTAANPVAVSGAVIWASGFSSLDADITSVVSDAAEKYKLHATQLSSETIITGTRSTAWNGTLTHTATLTFAGYTTPTPPTSTLVVSNANHARAFFNSGGKVRISASLTGFSATSKNSVWDTMFSQIGEVIFDYDTTTYTGSSGTGSSIGWYDLTTSNQIIFQKAAPAGSYAENLYVIRARRDASSTQVIFTIEFQDNDTGDPGIDENVDGTLSSVIGVNRASSSDVAYPFNIPAPANGGSSIA